MRAPRIRIEQLNEVVASLYDATELLATSWSPRVIQFYAEHYWKVDPYTAGALKLPMVRANVGRELIAPDQLRYSAFYNDFAIPYIEGACDLLGGMVPIGNGDLAMVGLHRVRGVDPFSRLDQRLFQLVLPHFQRAVKLLTRLEEADVRSAISKQSLDALPFGVLALGSDGRVLFVNEAAISIVDRHPALFARGRQLRLLRGPDDQRFRSILRDCADFREARGTAAGGILPLIDPSGSALSAYLMPMLTRQAVALAREALALPFLFPGTIRAADELLLRRTFELSVAEARIVARLCRGEGLSEISESARTSIHTVRNQLKSALHKVGARSQAELVAKVAQSPAALVPRQPKD